MGRALVLVAIVALSLVGVVKQSLIGPAVLGAVAPRLQDPEAALREALADVLGVIGDASTVPALETAAKDRDANVAASAKRAIARIQSR